LVLERHFLNRLSTIFSLYSNRQPGQSSKDDVSEKNFKEELLRKEQANSDKVKKTLARTAGGSYSNIGKIGLDIVAE